MCASAIRSVSHLKEAVEINKIAEKGLTHRLTDINMLTCQFCSRYSFKKIHRSMLFRVPIHRPREECWLEASPARH